MNSTIPRYYEIAVDFATKISTGEYSVGEKVLPVLTSGFQKITRFTSDVRKEYEKNGVVRKFPYCDYELSPVSPWNYGFAADTLEAEFRGVGEMPFGEDAPAVVLKVKAAKIDWGLEEGFENICAKIPESRTAIEAPETVELWPYGNAKLRMTELPKVE